VARKHCLFSADRRPRPRGGAARRRPAGPALGWVAAVVGGRAGGGGAAPPGGFPGGGRPTPAPGRRRARERGGRAPRRPGGRRERGATLLRRLGGARPRRESL